MGFFFYIYLKVGIYLFFIDVVFYFITNFVMRSFGLVAKVGVCILLLLEAREPTHFNRSIICMVCCLFDLLIFQDFSFSLSVY